MKVSIINIGDKVKYNVTFLRSIGSYSGDMPHATGTVIDITNCKSGLKLAHIRWDKENMAKKVNICNIVLLSRVSIDAALNT